MSFDFCLCQYELLYRGERAERSTCEIPNGSACLRLIWPLYIILEAIKEPDVGFGPMRFSVSKMIQRRRRGHWTKSRVIFSSLDVVVGGCPSCQLRGPPCSWFKANVWVGERTHYRGSDVLWLKRGLVFHFTLAHTHIHTHTHTHTYTHTHNIFFLNQLHLLLIVAQ